MPESRAQNLESLHEENSRLKRAVEELSVLNDLARAISGSYDSGEIMATVVRRSLRAVNAEQGVITLVEQQEKDTMKTLVRAAASSSQHEQFHLHQVLLGWMHHYKKPLLLNDPRNDPRFRGTTWDGSISSLMCVPLLMKTQLTGILTVYNKRNQEKFNEDDQRLLVIIAAQSAQVIENARLNERERQLLKMQEEIRLAAKIQADLLPKAAPAIAGYDIAGKSVPAQVVGGDYFDFIPIDENSIAVCLGDVTGKGLPASLLMANVQATLRGQTLGHTSAKKCIERSNTLLHQSTDAEKFVTLFYGILDVKNHALTFSNAGHDHPILLRNEEEPIRLTTGGIMLGTLEVFPFEEESLHLEGSDVLVIYSDGIAEAMNTNQEKFGEERIVEVIRQHRRSPAGAIIDALLEAARAHAGTAPQSDDMTIVVVKRTDGS